mgnify:CR=1 FL=1
MEAPIIRDVFCCSCCAMILHVREQEAVLINAREAVSDWLASRLELSGVYITERRHHMQEWKIQSAKVVKDELDITKRKKSLEELTDMICNLFSLEGINAYISKEMMD